MTNILVSYISIVTVLEVHLVPPLFHHTISAKNYLRSVVNHINLYADATALPTWLWALIFSYDHVRCGSTFQLLILSWERERWVD